METQLQQPNLKNILMGSTTNKYSTISIKKFREEVDSIEDDKARTLIEAYYLMAARLCELSAVANPSEVKVGATRPYGLFNTVSLENFEVTPAESPLLPKGINAITGKALVITVATAKRGRHILKKKPPAPETLNFTPEQIEETLKTYNQRELLKRWKDGEEEIDPQLIRVLREKLHFRPIAIPCDNRFEPWVVDLLKHFQKINSADKGNKFCFYLTRQEIRKIIRKKLKRILPPVMLTKQGGSHNLKNLLRHWRINHLVTYYNFNPQLLAIFAGWSIITSFQKAGVTGGSPTMEHYLHLAWKTYMPNLCRHLDDFVK